MTRSLALVLGSLASVFMAPIEAATPIQSAVHLVDVFGPPGSYSTVQDAVDAASDGDVVFIAWPEISADHFAEGFVLDGKGLTIMASPGRAWSLTGSLIRNVPDHSSVVLQGLAFHGTHAPTYPVSMYFGFFPHIPPTAAPGLRVEGCAGIVSLDLCVVAGHRDIGMKVLDSDLVTMRRVIVRGGRPPAPDPAFDGLHIERSRVDAEGSLIIGGSGDPGDCSMFGCSWCTGSGDGGDGMLVGQGGLVFASSCALSAGAGGQCGSCWHCDGYPGVTGRMVQGGRLVERDSRPASSSLGLDFVGPVDSLTDEVRSLGVPASVASDGALTVEARGAPGEVVYLLLSDEGGLHAEGVDGRSLMVATSLPNGRRRLGTIGPDGTLVTQQDLGLPLSSGVRDRHLQIAFLSPGGTRFSNAATVVQVGEDAPFLAESEPIRIDPHAAPNGNGRSWSQPHRSLTASRAYSLSNVLSGVEYWLVEGAFRGDELGRLDFVGSLRLLPNTALLGGFRRTDLHPSDRDLVVHRTSVSGDLLGDDGPGFANRVDNMDRFLVYTSNIPNHSWPGVRMEGMNFTGFGDGGPFPTPIMTLRSPLSVSWCHFSDNLAEDALISAPHISLDHTVWTGNHGLLVEAMGGGGPLRIEESLIVGNTADYALFYARYDDVILEGVTAAGNRLQHPDGAVFIQRRLTMPMSTRVRNCVFFRNTRDGSLSELAHVTPNDQSTEAHDIAWSLFEGWTGALPGSNIQSLDPLFVDPIGPDGIPFNADGNYRLQAQSPCIDAGDNAAVIASGASLDLDGTTRRTDVTSVPDTGNGTAPLVDMGAYEKRP